ncbi:MAG: hypothetical protein KDD40_07265, partial [Bdellovibrionales bacterium]|nr:hypothetical protein [Bdellovibrionales bacterium]
MNKWVLKFKGFAIIAVIAFQALPSYSARTARDYWKKQPADICNGLLSGNFRTQDFTSLAFLWNKYNSYEDYLKLLPSLEHNFPELKWLLDRVAAAPADVGAKAHPDSPSMKLHGEHHTEYDRTAVNYVNLAQILQNDYEGYTEAQTVPFIKLKKEQFFKIRSWFLKFLTGKPNGALDEIDLDKMEYLLAYTSFHDLGKSKFYTEIIEKVFLQADSNHDQILVYGIENKPYVTPSFDRIDKNSPWRSHLTRLLQNTGTFNFGQLLQGESPAVALQALLDTDGRPMDAETFEFYILHMILDMGAARAVQNPRGAALMISPVFLGFEDAMESLNFENKTIQEVYEDRLKNWAKKWGWPAESKKDLAVVRLALNSRAYENAEFAQKVKLVFEQLPELQQKILTQELMLTGIDDGIAIQLTYIPQLIQDAVKAIKSDLIAQSTDLTKEEYIKKEIATALVNKHTPESEEVLSIAYDTMKRARNGGFPIDFKDDDPEMLGLRLAYEIQARI